MLVCNRLHTSIGVNVSHRINIMVDEPAWRILEKLPRGERSRAINMAVIEWARMRKRRDAAARLNALSDELPAVTMEEVVRWIREDRERDAM